jgi:hypothetical protein
VKKEQDYFHPSNEVMVKERIPASMTTKIVVSDVQTRNKLVYFLKKHTLKTAVTRLFYKK